MKKSKKKVKEEVKKYNYFVSLTIQSFEELDEETLQQALENMAVKGIRFLSIESLEPAVDEEVEEDFLSKASEEDDDDDIDADDEFYAEEE